jgi:hypothetical protein
MDVCQHAPEWVRDRRQASESEICAGLANERTKLCFSTRASDTGLHPASP